ncbi:MAG: CDP-alcohol phosphatidyltransferase family protein [Acidobacteria bacterium]|nr:CDP-alcohol phosphatidyltransferase family protein [Acidobacteriota bacterium]
MVRKAVLLNLADCSRAPARLAGLPLLLRVVLTAQRAGIEKILIAGGADPGPLLRDKRVQLAWRWMPLQADGKPPAELEALRAVGSELKENFVLLFADSIFDANALASLATAELDGRLARVAALSNAADPLRRASLYLCSPELLRQLGDESGPNQLELLTPRLRERGQLDAVEVSGQLWPRTSDREQLRAIHRELTHFHLKPSDGIFAKFNKLVVAESLIRFFLRTPATPNFVTGLGLFFALGSGWAFAQGNYGWSLAGALLFYVSAIMDHVDGMVARLKCLESEFGVWFESTADYASYLSVFVGLALGLYRETGFAHHLLVGGLFLFGWVMSFILMSRQRHRVSGDNPTDYPNRVHVALEKQGQNFFHWLARKCYFLVRRAVLPYIILVFCLLDLRVLLLGWVAFGANVVWLLTLYNNRLFRTPKPTAPAEAH